MRPSFGVMLELAALTAVAYLATAFASWYPLSILVLLVAQALTTVLVHCPSHYLVGRALGIKFREMGLAASTATKVMPGSLNRISSLLPVPVPTLRVDSQSRKTSSPGRLRLMFLAGASGSVASAVVFAFVVTLSGNLASGIINWVFASIYLASNIILSPRAGDLMRARAVSGRR